MVKIEYWNSYDILDTHYTGSYKNRFWLNVIIKKPTYPIYREQFEDSVNDSHNVFLKWEKQYSFDLFATEPVADMISMITLHDNVWITFDNGYSAKCRDFTAEVKWSNIESLAQITCTFTVKSYVINGASASHC